MSMAVRSFIVALVLIGVFSGTSLAYKIHVKNDTIYVHTKPGVMAQPGLLVISSRDGEDTATLNKQGWDTIRVSLESDNQFYWQGTWAKKPIPFLTQRSLYLDYIPTSLAHSTAIVTVQGDSNTIRIVVIGIPDTNYECLKVIFGPFWPAGEGQSGVVADTLVNLTDSSAVIDSIRVTYPDNAVFRVQGLSFPFTLAPHSSVPIPISYTIPSPALNQTYGATFFVWSRGASPDLVACTSAVGYAGIRLFIPKDTFTVSFHSNPNDTIDISVKSALSLHYLQVQNASGGQIILTDAVIADTSSLAQFQGYYGPHCRIIACQGKCYCLNDTLDQSDVSDVIPILITANDTGSHIINVVLSYAGSANSPIYTLRIHYVRTSETGTVQSPSLDLPPFPIHPNPARNEATISLPTRSTIEIYDVLGNLVDREEATGKLVWSPKSGAAGSYIVRVVERRADGTTSSCSKRLVFVR
jgi:hypothetical protein